MFTTFSASFPRSICESWQTKCVDVLQAFHMAGRRCVLYTPITIRSGFGGHHYNYHTVCIRSVDDTGSDQLVHNIWLSQVPFKMSERMA